MQLQDDERTYEEENEDIVTLMTADGEEVEFLEIAGDFSGWEVLFDFAAGGSDRRHGRGRGTGFRSQPKRRTDAVRHCVGR